MTFTYPAQRAAGADPQMKWIGLYPELAEEFLANRLPNRPASERKVDAIARDIIADRWHVNHQGLAFTWRDGKWRMHDGEHRCRAVIKAGIPVRVHAAFGTDPEGVDVGRPRQFSGQLAIDQRVPQTNTIAAIARLVCIWRTSGHPPGTGSKLSPTWDEMDALLADHQCIIDTITLVDKMRRGCGLRASIGGWLRFATSHLGTECKSEDDDWFLNKLVAGDGLHNGHPALTLRNRIMADKTFGKDAFRLSAGCVYAWNAYREGRDLAILKIPADLTPAKFPEAR